MAATMAEAFESAGSGSYIPDEITQMKLNDWNSMVAEFQDASRSEKGVVKQASWDTVSSKHYNEYLNERHSEIFPLGESVTGKQLSLDFSGKTSPVTGGRSLVLREESTGLPIDVMAAREEAKQRGIDKLKARQQARINTSGQKSTEFFEDTSAGGGDWSKILESEPFDELPTGQTPKSGYEELGERMQANKEFIRDRERRPLPTAAQKKGNFIFEISSIEQHNANEAKYKELFGVGGDLDRRYTREGDKNLRKAFFEDLKGIKERYSIKDNVEALKKMNDVMGLGVRGLERTDNGSISRKVSDRIWKITGGRLGSATSQSLRSAISTMNQAYIEKMADIADKAGYNDPYSYNEYAKSHLESVRRGPQGPMTEKAAAAAAEKSGAKSIKGALKGAGGKAAAVVGLLGLGAVIGNMFSGGHRSNAELYNPNGYSQYYS